MKYVPKSFVDANENVVQLEPFNVSAFKAVDFNLKKCTLCGLELKEKTKIKNAWIRIKK